MASSTDQALQVIHQAYKDILVQAGKHFRVMAKDGPGALVGTHSGIRAKTSDALTQYHLALNEIESEIIRAKSVLLRDLENLHAARAPAPAPAPVAVPVPIPIPIPIPTPTPQPVAPPAPMMELPSSAAHSRNLNTAVAATATYHPSKETKTVAPFPDMGMGMSSDVVDLTVGEKKPSPRVQPGSVKPVARSAPPTNVKPSPKPVHKPMPPAKVTPVPPPQIPRLQAMQSSTASTQPKSQPAPQPQPPKPAQPAQPVQQAPATKTVQNNAMDSTLGLPSTGVSAGIGAGTGNGELNFTHMEFSLAPPPSEPQGAPPAPMPEFDLATFAPQSGNSNATTSNTAGNNPTQPPNANSNMDDLFDLGDTNGGGDNMFDLGGGEANDNTFDDLMFFGNNDSDMAQFDDAYFGI